MAQASEQGNAASLAAQNAAGAAELEAANSAVLAQDGGDSAGSRGDSSATQVQTRGLEFNPANEPAPATSGVASTGAQPAGAASGVQSEYTDALDYARGRGLDVSGFTDSTQLIETLLTSYQGRQQQNVYEQLGQQLAPRAQEIQTYLNQQQQLAAQPKGPQPWEAPEFNPVWGQMVEQVPGTEFYVGKPGTPPAITEAVNKYAQFQKKLAQNPVAPTQAYVEQTVPQMVQQAVQQHMQTFQRQQEVQGIIARNSEWMYQTDQSGRQVMGLNGRPAVTPQGQRYASHVQNLESQGMRNPSQIDQIARQLVMGELHSAQLAQHQAGNPAPAQRQAAVASGRAQANVLQSLIPPGQANQAAPGTTQPNTEGLSLHELLLRNLTAAGFTDADFQDLDSMR